MERGGPFSGLGRHANSSSGFNLFEAGNTDTKSSTSSNPNMDNTNNVNQGAPQFMLREQDQYMPIANVIRIMRQILPPHAKISDDAKETIQECVSEFISFITSEANEKCRHEQRKTVTADDVLWAMEKVGFDDYVEPLAVFLNRYRMNEGSRSAQRGEPVASRSNLSHGPALGMTQPLAFYGPGFFVDLDSSDRVSDPMSMGGLYRDGSGSGASGPSSAQNAPGNFDPSARLK